MSEDNPIGKVAHYYCWREYQGRGLQHFHFAIWIQGAPALGQNSKDKAGEDDTICDDSETIHNDNGKNKHAGDDTDEGDTNLRDEDEKIRKK